MKNLTKILSIFIVVLAMFSNKNTSAQTYANAAEYMNDITKALGLVQENLWDYTNAISHSKNARKIEKRRIEIIEAIKSSKTAVWKMPSYKSDKALRDSAYSFLKISLAVMTEDYSKLVNMEDVAEQSYDAMEAYILAKQIAYSKQDTSIRMLNAQYKIFAATNDITLTDAKDKTAQKLEAAGKVYDYYNKVYLVFFKSFKQEVYVMDALNKNDVSSLKQNSDALLKFSTDGMQKLEAIGSFSGDATLKNLCREILQFYKTEAEKNLPAIADFLVKKETFEKIKKSIDSKPASKRTQADVDAFNTAVTDYNTSMTAFNSTIQKLNDGRGKLLDKWNGLTSTFTDKHVPKNN